MSKYRIRIFSNFCPSENCKDVYERLCESELQQNYGPDKEIFITNDNYYSHAIILNTAMPNLSHLPKKNVIGFAFEPIQFLGLSEEFVRYAQQYIGKYYIGDKMNLPDPFVEKFSHMWHNQPLKYLPEKTKSISMMVSEKNQLSGHKYRHDLINKILETGYQRDNIVYTTPRNCIANPGEFYLIPFRPRLIDLATVIYLAAFDGHQEIFLLGYTDETAGGNDSWIGQIADIFSSYAGVKFYLVGEDSRMPDVWVDCFNVCTMPYSEFISYCDV
jgi:hypothetical protein